MEPQATPTGAITLRPGRRSAERDGVTVTLTKTEYILLDLLVQADGDAVPYRRLIEALWGDRSDDPRTRNRLQAHISGLRRKLDDPCGLNTIQAIYDLGYVLVDEPDRAARPTGGG